MIDIGWAEDDFWFIEEATDRSSIRRAVHTQCQVVAEWDFRLLGERTLDISREGLLLDTRAAAAVGEPVFIALKVPSGSSWIDAMGRVVRIVRGRRGSDAGRGIGIRFEQMSPLDRAILNGSLVGRPPSIPARRVRPDYAATVAALMVA